MEIFEVTLTQEINAFDGHYWARMKANITPDEDAIKSLNILKGKLAKFAEEPSIQVEKKHTEELPVIDVND
jgi:hypothetical protein